MGSKNNIVVSVGRQYGSQGRVIGKLIAQKMGFSFYDVELINLAAKEIGFDPSLFAKADEKPGLPRFFQNVGEVLFGAPTAGDDNYLSHSKMFEIQSEVIRKVADDGPCVIMGRCSDYVLRTNPNCFSVFLSAPMTDRIKCVMQRSGIADEDKAKKQIEKVDKRRSEYYNYFTDKEWGHSFSYNLCIDVSMLGVERTSDFICDFLRERFSGK